MTAEIFWPASRIGEGLELLARAAGLPVRGAPGAPGLRSPGLQGPGDLHRHASALGLHAEPVETSAGQVTELLRGAAPAVVRADDDRFVMIVRARGGRLTIVRPDLRVTTIPAGLVRQAIVEPIAAPLTAETARLVEEAGVRPSKRPALVAALLAERLRDRRVQAGWVLRVPAGGGVRAQLAASGARRQLMLLVLAHAAQYAMWVVAWWLLGSAALQGRLDAAWLGAWTIALCTVVPLQLVTLWLQGRLSIVVGALLKQRLLAGAFGLEAEHVRREGAGRLLGRVIEAQAVESLALGGGFLALLAIFALAAGILTLASPLLTILLLVWTVATGALAWRYSRRRQTWVGLRVGLTHDLIERMAGHRTRLAQQPRERWHDGEDEALERYVQASAQMDRATVWLLALVPRGWILIGLCGLTPLFLRGGSPAALAIGLGGSSSGSGPSIV